MLQNTQSLRLHTAEVAGSNRKLFRGGTITLLANLLRASSRLRLHKFLVRMKKHDEFMLVRGQEFETRCAPPEPCRITLSLNAITLCVAELVNELVRKQFDFSSHLFGLANLSKYPVKLRD